MTGSNMIYQQRELAVSRIPLFSQEPGHLGVSSGIRKVPAKAKERRHTAFIVTARTHETLPLVWAAKTS
jgi:hypothetical protein